MVETKTGGGRRGGTEHFFRAVQRALFDKSSWTALAPLRRGDVTGETITTYIDRVAERVAEAIDTGTINKRDERHFTWTAMHFDEQAWREMIGATDSLFGRSLKVGVEAGVRLTKSGETPIPVTMAFACFESPPTEMRPLKGLLAERLMAPAGFHTESIRDGNNSWAFVSQRLARAMKHPLRMRILVELNKRAMSASEFTNEYGEGASLSVVSKHFRYLERLGCIELVDTKSGGQRRGRTEYFFRAIQRSLFDESSWSRLPHSVKAEITGVTFTTYVERLAAAVAAGTMDARLDRHLTWTGMRFDERAWGKMVSATDDLFRKAVTLQLEAASRLETSGETPISVTTGFSCLESPRDSIS